MESRSLWLDIPEEILTIISSHLYGKDIIILLYCICKSWRSALSSVRPFPPPPSSPLSQYPCLLFLNMKNRFYHPIYDGIYNSHISKLFDPDSHLCFSYNNWLLLHQPHSLLFINSFTNHKIKIPSPIYNGVVDRKFYALSCSSHPTFPDSTLFGISTSDHDQRIIIISTRKRGQDDWNSHSFSFKIGKFTPSRCKPVFHNNSYFFLGKAGNLAIFNPPKCTIECNNKYIRRKLRSWSFQRFLVQVERELVAVFLSLNGTWLRVFKLNHSQKDWDPLYCLGDHILFLSYHASFSQLATNKLVTGNKIYFPKFYQGSMIYYCLSTREYHSQDGRYHSKHLYDTQDFSHCTTWVKPNYEEASSLVEPWFNDSNSDDTDSASSDSFDSGIASDSGSDSDSNSNSNPGTDSNSDDTDSASSVSDSDSFDSGIASDSGSGSDSDSDSNPGTDSNSESTIMV